MRHCLPLVLSNLVFSNIIQLGGHEQQDRKHVDDNQIAIATLVERLVILTVDIGRRNSTELDQHFHRISVLIATESDLRDLLL
jgi:hypothetical protein